MTDSIIVAGVSFLGGLIALMVPVIKLNGNITRLTTVVERIEALFEEKTDRLDERVTKHGREIDSLKLEQAKHAERIKQLEK